MSVKKPVVGVIGGSGMYELAGLTKVREERLKTPYGDPSDAFIVGDFDEVELVFCSRHSRGHKYTPSTVPYLANVWAMKKLGVEWLIAVSAVGSLKAEHKPGHMLIVDQYIDKTFLRPNTFFETGCVGHVEFADPVCSVLSDWLHQSAGELGLQVKKGGTYVCMEGPAFSTRAESRLHRQWGADLIGMTGCPEAKLAREAGISYACIALVTDYDCWHESEEDVSVEMVLRLMHQNAVNAKKVIRKTAGKIAASGKGSPYKDIGRTAIITDRKQIPPLVKSKLSVIFGRHLDG